MNDFVPLAPGPVMLRSELLALGYTDREITQLARLGHLRRIRWGAYVAADLWDDAAEARRHGLLARAVVKQARTDVVVSHVSALPEYDAPTWGCPLDDVHVIRRDQRAGRQERGVRQHQGALLQGDVVERNGVSVTGPDRTPLDVTTVVGVEPSLIVMNHFLHTGLTTPERLRRRYDAMRQDPFTLRTDLVLRPADPRVESVGESRTMFLCWRHGVPSPVPQWPVLDGGGVVARLDFAWPEHAAWLEFDGRDKYVTHLRDGESVTDAVLREKQRESMISELTGWRCIRLTWSDLQRPEHTAVRIKRLLGRVTSAPSLTP